MIHIKKPTQKPNVSLFDQHPHLHGWLIERDRPHLADLIKLYDDANKMSVALGAGTGMVTHWINGTVQKPSKTMDNRARQLLDEIRKKVGGGDAPAPALTPDVAPTPVHVPAPAPTTPAGAREGEYIVLGKPAQIEKLLRVARSLNVEMIYVGEDG